MSNAGIAQLISFALVVLLGIVAGYNYKRYGKLAIVLCVLCIFLSINSFYWKFPFGRSAENLTGIFKIDTVKSRLGSADISMLRDAVLKVYPENIFEISGVQLTSNTGSWEYFDDGDVFWVEYKFEHEEHSSPIQPTDGNTWTFESDSLTKPEDSYVLVFRKE